MDAYYSQPIAKGNTYKLLDNTADIHPTKNSPFKVVIVGDSGCGKTSLFTSYIRGYFPTDYEPTIFENHRAFVQSQTNEILTVDLWDTAGQEDYERIRRLSYQDANVVILAYSLDAKDSLLNIPEVWAPEIINFCPNTPIILAGLKSDVAEYKVDPYDAMKVAQNIGAVAHVPCSAKQMYNVEELFDACFNVVYNGKKVTPGSPSKRTSGHFRSHSKQNSITKSLNSITEGIRRRKNVEREPERVEESPGRYQDDYEVREPDFGYDNNYTRVEEKSGCCVIT
ncbi:DEKNAAC104414 [Brettanomyces naardenensis]|uniref:DEKNAAC104414 n=1 Tax=Brettanomyces naardenensis TaxID=13370 RepID=A0A448YQR5_BRENA|nr:DEKNAAC104414 [Brettanomyces naardenensis]